MVSSVLGSSAMRRRKLSRVLGRFGPRTDHDSERMACSFPNLRWRLCASPGASGFLIRAYGNTRTHASTPAAVQALATG